MIGNAIDNLISVFSPGWGAKRMANRQYGESIKNAAGVHESMRKLLSGRNAGGYEAGKSDRLKGRTVGSAHENDVPRRQIETLRWRAWNLHRNCPQARKISRTLCAKVVGRGLSPQPQATKKDGSPFVDFRKRARQVWEEFVGECDFRGKPGLGGHDLVTLSKTALRGTILSGGVLFRFHHLDPKEQQKRDLHLPLQIQLLHIDRLDTEKNGDNQYYGFDLDSAGRVTAYNVLKGGTDDNSTERSVKVPAAEMRHLFSEEDIDQFIGSPWLGAALLTMDDRRGYEYSELIAAEMASCFVAAYRRSAGQSGGIGLQNDGDRDLTDSDGNPITKLQPGMILDLGQTGELDLKNPSRPNSNAEGFLAHLVRSEAVSMPGVKSSTLTGDYRNSSFSSERSADNDIWPELEELQDWFANEFVGPIYREVISVAVAAGKFEDIKEFAVDDFNARKREYLKVNWQGPVARSINPKDDAIAARSRVQNATSSPQREGAKLGRDWREILQEQSEFIEYCEELGLPEIIWQQALGIMSTTAAVEPEPDPDDEKTLEEKEAAREDEDEPEDPTETEDDDDVLDVLQRRGGFAVNGSGVIA